MKKIAFFLLIILFSFFLTGCSLEPIDISENLVEPEPVNYILDGEWRLKKHIIMDLDGLLHEKDPDIKERALFKEEYFYLNRVYSGYANYSLKNVKIRNYLLSRYNIEAEALGIESYRSEVISIEEEAKFLAEIIMLDQDLFLYIDGENFLFYERISKEVHDLDIIELIDDDESNVALNQDLEEEELGLLLGSKVYLEEEGDFKYESIYIDYHEGKEPEIYRIDDLLVARRNGFYLLKSRLEDMGAYPYHILSLEGPREDSDIRFDDRKVFKEILYVGNDYISLENSLGKKSELRLYPLDYLDKNKNIKLSEVIGQDKKEFIEENQEMGSMDEDNFGLIREKGYWRFLGRKELSDSSGNYYKDFLIKASPPKSVVNYDKFWIPWAAVKSLDPDIIDGFISPNKTLLVAETLDSIKLYKLIADSLEAEEIASFEKDPDMTIVMSEWATGKYRKIWKEELLKYK